MSEVFKEMSIAYQQATKRIDTLEKGRQEDIERIKMLEKNCHEFSQRIEMLEKGRQEDVERIKMLEKKIDKLEKGTKQAETDVAELEFELKKRIELLEKKVEELQKQNAMSILLPRLLVFDNELVPYDNFYSNPVKTLQEKLMTIDNNLQEAKRKFEEHDHNNALPLSSVMYDNLSSNIKQVEEKVLEQERVFNAVNVCNSELELQLQAFLASTHNGAFLWRIPEVQRRI